MGASPELVQATWAAGYQVVTADGTTLDPGDLYKLPRAEAEASDNWHVEKPDKPKAKPDKPKAKAGEE